MQIDVSYRRIALLTYPVAISQMCETLMGVIDTIMVGRLGVTELAAVGFAGMVSFWFMSVFLGMFSGVNALVAQAYGAGDDRGCGVAAWQGAYLALGGTVALGLLWFVIPTLFLITGATPEVQRLASGYMRIRMLGGSAFCLLLLATNFYRGLGRTIVPMWFGIAECVLNVALNYALIFGKVGCPALGVEGAALGSVLAQAITALALCITIFLNRAVRERYHILAARGFNAPAFRELLRVSWPIGVQSFVDMGAIIVFGTLVARLGDAQLAATNAAIQAWVLALMPVAALGIGATTLVGHCVGAQQFPEARHAVRKLLRMGYGLNAGFALVYLIAPIGFMSLFLTPEDLPQVLPYARPLLTIVVLCMVFETQFNIGSGALRGAGDTRFPMVLNIGVAWCVFAPLAMVMTPRYGVLGGWVCLIVFCGLCATGIRLRFRSNRWVELATRATPAPVARDTAEPGHFPALAQ